MFLLILLCIIGIIIFTNLARNSHGHTSSSESDMNETRDEIDYSLFKHPEEEKKKATGVDYDGLSNLHKNTDISSLESSMVKTRDEIDYSLFKHPEEEKKKVTGVDYDGLSNLHKSVDESMAEKYNKYINMPYYDFDDRFYDKFVAMFDKYEECCDNAKEYFNNHFDINQRIKMLEKCINIFNEIRAKCLNYGENGKKLYGELLEDEYKECFQDWSKNKITTNTNGDDYEFEFEKMDFSNYDFLTYLLNLYKTDTENQKRHLKQEKLYYTIFEEGGTEEYKEMLEHKEKLQAIRNDIIKILKKEDCILQSTLVHKVDEGYGDYVRKYISELHQKGIVSKEKSGSSYMLKYIQK